MEWLQQHDPLAKDFGYLLRYMPVRTYILLRDLERMPEIWETDPMFADFVKLAKNFPIIMKDLTLRYQKMENVDFILKNLLTKILRTEFVFSFNKQSKESKNTLYLNGLNQ